MPLRTNEEMVRILRRYDEQNDIEGIVPGMWLVGFLVPQSRQETILQQLEYDKESIVSFLKKGCFTVLFFKKKNLYLNLSKLPGPSNPWLAI